MFWPLTKRRAKPKRVRNEGITKEVISFGGREIILRRVPYRRKIAITVNLKGQVIVSTLMGSPLSYIQDYLRDQEAWITRALKQFESVRVQHPPKLYKQDELFPFMGKPVPLMFERGEKSAIETAASPERLLFRIPPAVWDSGFDVHAPHPEFATTMKELYQKLGKKFLRERLDFYSKSIGLYPSSVAIRSQKTRWGSCSYHRKVSLNWKLMFAPIEVIDYVVVHELIHLEHYNHSPKFWKAVEEIVPNYRECKAYLTNRTFEADFLAKSSVMHM